ncbi:MAG: adenylate/guanylate cyclase domain-containing protein [Microscillaceae bacterium]|nr:adenylate/guanylate cyclase domain-containing protein [Microscillaceae bacterium]
MFEKIYPKSTYKYIWFVFLFLLLGFIAPSEKISRHPLNNDNKYALEAEYIYRFVNEIPSVDNKTIPKGQRVPFINWGKFGSSFKVGILVSDLKNPLNPDYQNIAYVLKYHKTIQGKRVETEALNQSDLNRGDSGNWQMIILGHDRVFPNYQKAPQNTLLVSIAREPIKIPDNPSTYDSSAFSPDKKSLIIAESYLMKQSMVGSHIRFFNMQLDHTANSPTFLVFRIDEDFMKESGFNKVDSLKALQKRVVENAQNRLLLSNDQFVDMTLEAIRLKKIADDSTKAAKKSREEAEKQKAEAQKQAKIAKEKEQEALDLKTQAENQRDRAIKAETDAKRQRDRAIEAEEDALLQKLIALAERDTARIQKTLADSLTSEAIKQKQEIEKQKDVVENQKKEVEAQKKLADEALIKAERRLRYLVILGILTAFLIGTFLYFRFRLIRKSKRQTEALLLNTLPPAIVKELQDTGRTVMRRYERVSILFTDFKGFSEITKNMTADEMIVELNDCFTAFDEIIKKYGFERIKTIGDAYMCAGGLPEVNYHHPVTMILVGLEMQRFMQRRFEERKGDYWMCRLGVNVGAVRAGVVGISKFAYDLWGNAVNIASRLESGGEVYKVNTNESTYEMVKDFFEAEFRGEIEVKHGLVIPMYFITGIKPELSVHGDGIQPNALFQQKLKEFEIACAEEVRRLEELDTL